MRLSIFALSLLAGFLLSAHQVQAAAAVCDPLKPSEYQSGLTACFGKPCNGADVGKTTMDYDKKNIVACLIDDTGTSYIWKSMSMSGSVGYPKNHPVITIKKISNIPGYFGLIACSAYTDETGAPYINACVNEETSNPICFRWIKGEYAYAYSGVRLNSKVECNLSPWGLSLSGFQSPISIDRSFAWPDDINDSLAW